MTDDLRIARGICLSAAIGATVWLTAWSCARADEMCRAPNIPRVVRDFRAVTNIPGIAGLVWFLACPAEGPCEYRMTMDIPADPVARVECLTPDQNAEAERRWR
jgi:hypothetical protein